MSNLTQNESFDSVTADPLSLADSAAAPWPWSGLKPTTADERRVAHYLAPTIKTVQRLGLEAQAKRVIDVILASVALVLLSPLFVSVAFAVAVSSQGPVLFAQTRVGKGGRLFRFFKFRSMVIGAEVQKAMLRVHNESTGPIFKMRHDPRITPVGRFIRKYSLDELPQLINVLTGDMSLVGPRPPVPQEVAQYEAWQLRRLSVTPGLTCIWQTSGRSRVTFEEWMRMDLEYIDQWNLWLDAKLLAKTVITVVTADGAY